LYFELLRESGVFTCVSRRYPTKPPIERFTTPRIVIVIEIVGVYPICGMERPKTIPQIPTAKNTTVRTFSFIGLTYFIFIVVRVFWSY